MSPRVGRSQAGLWPEGSGMIFALGPFLSGFPCIGFILTYILALSGLPAVGSKVWAPALQDIMSPRTIIMVVS